jgi:hypothetical protein
MMQMGQTLRGKQFSFQARTLRVYADTDGRFPHIGHALKVVVRRPDRLRTDIDGDDGVNQLFYDGKTLVLYSPAKKLICRGVFRCAVGSGRWRATRGE